MMNSISELLERKSVRYIRIDGSTSSEERNRLVLKFQGHNSPIFLYFT
jgi:SNF2 family DNA or RNA helicase